MEEMAEMCGQGEEGRQLAHDELEIMKSGNMSAMESTMAHELAVYVEELCQVPWFRWHCLPPALLRCNKTQL